MVHLDEISWEASSAALPGEPFFSGRALLRGCDLDTGNKYIKTLVWVAGQLSGSSLKGTLSFSDKRLCKISQGAWQGPGERPGGGGVLCDHGFPVVSGETDPRGHSAGCPSGAQRPGKVIWHFGVGPALLCPAPVSWALGAGACEAPGSRLLCVR